jgi:hypothetical protein
MQDDASKVRLPKIPSRVVIVKRNGLYLATHCGTIECHLAMPRIHHRRWWPGAS